MLVSTAHVARKKAEKKINVLVMTLGGVKKYNESVVQRSCSHCSLTSVAVPKLGSASSLYFSPKNIMIPTGLSVVFLVLACDYSNTMVAGVPLKATPIVCGRVLISIAYPICVSFSGFPRNHSALAIPFFSFSVRLVPSGGAPGHMFVCTALQLGYRPEPSSRTTQ